VIVTMPDGQAVNFPDDMPKEQIRSLIASKYPDDSLVKSRGDTGARRFIQQPLQGMTLGYSDEITGSLGGLLAKGYDEARALMDKERLFPDESVSDLASAGIDTARKDIKQQVQERPLESIGLQLAGGIAGGAAGASTKAGQAIASSVRNAGTGGRIAKSALVGSTAGAVAGLGGGEGGVDERLSDAATGAAMGGVVGGAIPAVGAVFRVGKNAITGRQADKLVADSLTGRNIQALRKGLSDADSPLSLVDLGGDESRSLLRSAAKFDSTQNLVSDYLTNRSVGAANRIGNVLSKKVSNVENYFQNIDDLAKARASIAQPAYQEAYKKGAKLKVTTRLNTLLKDSRIDAAMNKAKAEYGVSAEAARNSLESIDGVKKVLDDSIGAAMRSGEKEKAAAFLKLKSELLKEVDSLVPEYKKARSIFSGFKALEDAQQTGASFLKLDPEEIAKLRKGMTAGEHDAFLIGVRKSLQNAVDRVGDKGNTAARIFGNPAYRNRIKAAFPDEKTFDSFAKRMNQEIKAQDTFNKVIGGSRTDFNIASDEKVLDFVQKSAQISPSVAAVDTLFTVLKSRAAGLNDKNAKKLAKILLSKKEGIKALDRMIASEKGVQQKLLTASRPFVENVKTGAAITSGIQGQ